MQDDHLTWIQMLKDGVSEQDIDDYLSPKKNQQPNQNGERPILKPGGPGLLGCISRLTDGKGHFEVTQDVLKSLNIFGPITITNIARASRLPDLLYFNDHRYHAQSRVDEKHYPIDPRKDIEEFQFLFQRVVTFAKESLSTNEIISFCFYLGTILHMVQDLATHQGMSNPEHAYLDKHNCSPDNNIALYELSKKASTWVLNNYLLEEIMEKSNWRSLTNEVKWREFSKLKMFLEVGLQGIIFKFNPLKERNEKNTIRWFSWSEWESHDNAITNMKSILK